ncbi:MAG: amidohydrolase family protein [Bacteroidetes bacterium]|nr:amidohydrolase family protein [Bacteroidota bacterium]
MKDTAGLAARVAEFRKKGIDRLQRALKFGVKIAAGSDDYGDSKLPYGEPSKHVLIGYHEAGIPVAQVLQIATRNSAEQLNWGRWIGILKKDYVADIIAVDNTIGTDINALLHVHFVMKSGVVYVNNCEQKN